MVVWLILTVNTGFCNRFSLFTINFRKFFFRNLNYHNNAIVGDLSLSTQLEPYTIGQTGDLDGLNNMLFSYFSIPVKQLVCWICQLATSWGRIPACIASLNRPDFHCSQLQYTCEVSVADDVTLLWSTLVITTIRLMNGTATESRLVPVTVTSVPPLKWRNNIL